MPRLTGEDLYFRLNGITIELPPLRQRQTEIEGIARGGLFGKPKNPAHIEKVLRELSLWDKRDSKIMTFSGGMKRRVLIAKALSHEPQIHFLDEPTAGVDVELRRDMWKMVRSLRETGVARAPLAGREHRERKDGARTGRARGVRGDREALRHEAARTARGARGEARQRRPASRHS